MKLRSVMVTTALVVLTALVGSAAVVEYQLSRNDAGDETTVQVPMGDDVPKYSTGTAVSNNLPWERENAFLWTQQYLRIGEGLTVGRRASFPSVRPGTGEPIRVLVLGDSFVWGMGYDDPSAMWPEQLEDALNNATAPGSFEVVTHGKYGMSTLGQAEWLTAERMSQLSPDVIVLGLVTNDVVPNGDEQSVCPDGCLRPIEAHPAYRACIDGKRGLVGNLVRTTIGRALPRVTHELLQRYCDTDRLADAYRLPTTQELIENLDANPYLPQWEQSVARLRQVTGDTPFLVAPIGGHTNAGYERLADVFTRTGMTTVPMPTRSQYFDRETREQLIANPVDGHPSPFMGKAFVTDLTPVIVESIPVERMRKAATSVDATEPVVVNASPVSMTVERNDERMASFVFEPIMDKGVRYEIAGRTFPAQLVPCMTVGHPNLRFAFDRQLPLGTEITVGFTGPKQLQLVTYGYASDMSPVLGKPRAVRSGQPITFTTSPQVRGVHLIDTSAGCGIEDVVTFPRTTVSISRR